MNTKIYWILKEGQWTTNMILLIKHLMNMTMMNGIKKSDNSTVKGDEE